MRKAINALDIRYASMDSGNWKHVKNVSQIFEVSNGAVSFNVFNFTPTILSGVPLQKMMNAIREMDHQTGGESTAALSAIMILTEDAPRWKQSTEEAKVAGAVGTNAYFLNGAIVINEKVLKSERSQSAYEKPEGDSFSIAGDDIEAIVFHELTHVAEHKLLSIPNTKLPSEKFGWNAVRGKWGHIDSLTPLSFEGDTKSPSRYGQTAAGEDVAESATAMYVGGEWGTSVDESRQKAIGDLYRERHSGEYGPELLTCEELNLNDVAESGKVGSRLMHGVTVKPKYTYEIDK